MDIETRLSAEPLDPTNPQPMYVAEETLDFRHRDFSSRDSLLMPAFSLQHIPTSLTTYLHYVLDAPLPLLRSARNSKFRITVFEVLVLRISFCLR